MLCDAHQNVVGHVYILQRRMALNFERVSWAGSLVVIMSVLPALFFLVSPASGSRLSPSCSLLPKPHSSPLELSLPLRSDLAALSPGVSQDQISFSIDPLRPDVQGTTTRFLIRLKDSRQMIRVEMPARIGLAFDSAGVLQFSNDSSLFWLECHLLADHRMGASLFYRTPSGSIVTHAEWIPVPMETPLQTADEFSQDNPFRELAESKWWGPDLLAQKVQGGVAVHRLEMGGGANSKLVDCKVGDWFMFNGKVWEKCARPVAILDEPSRGKNPIDQNLPLAHILTATSQFLEVEGWNERSHVRFRWNLAPLPPFKIKTEELFSQLRVRSEKQVSCMMDKQCLVLRPGDWVLKTGGRWKALRKAEEKEALLAGDVLGEVFILEKIGVVPSSKNIVGWYFSAGRTQSVSVELAQRTQKGRKASR
jgi:hypothetical protein